MKEVLESLTSLCVEAISSFDELVKQQSEIESRVSDLYHVLELVPMNAVEQMKVTKQLKLALQQRRAIKDKIRYANSLRDHLSQVQMKVKQVDKNIMLDTTRYLKESKASYYKVMKESVKHDQN